MFPIAQEVTAACPCCPKTECAQPLRTAHLVSAGLRVARGRLRVQVDRHQSCEPYPHLGRKEAGPDVGAEESGLESTQQNQRNEALTARHRDRSSSHTALSF